LSVSVCRPYKIKRRKISVAADILGLPSSNNRYPSLFKFKYRTSENLTDSAPPPSALSSKFSVMMIQSIFAPLMLTAALGMANQSPRADSGNGTVFDAQFSSLIQEAMDANNITGMAVGVLLPDGGVEFGAWGNRTENGEKIAPDVCFVPLSFNAGDLLCIQTIFGLGSLSKGFLSASLGILMQDFATGKNATALPSGVTEFNWDTKLRDLLPGEWMTEDEFSTSKATLVDLLSHVTGLPR
jgi:hypothetical protein